MLILLVEDDPVIGASVQMNLDLEGFSVAWVKGIQEANQKIQEQAPDLVILDLSLPDGYGMNLCRDLRANGFDRPILILSAESDVDSVVKGFQTGANDYIRKPFSNRELIARVRAHESQAPKRQKVLQFGGLVVDPDRRLATFDGKELPLNRREFDLLSLLIESQGFVVRRELILTKLTKGEEILDRTVDSHMSHLRARLRQVGISGVRIRTEYGVGYKLVLDE